MRALRIVAEKQVIVRDRPRPVPGEGEVLIKVRASGICGSDLHPYRHPTPGHLTQDFIPGHEPAGDIVEVGPGVAGWSVGDRVVVYFRRTCGECINCRTGRSEICFHRMGSYGHLNGYDGSDAEFMAVHTRCLLQLPEYLSYVEGAIIACQAGTAYWPLKRLGVSGRDTLVVSGLGPVGLLAILFAKPMGAHIVGVDPSAGRREIAASLGADHTIDPTAGPVGEQIQAIVPERGTCLIETSGSSAAHAVIGELVRAGGTAAIVGLGNPEFKMPMMMLAHRELTVFGSSIYPDTMFAEICTFIRDRGVKLERVVSHYMPLEKGPEAFQIAEQATSGKVCFTFD